MLNKDSVFYLLYNILKCILLVIKHLFYRFCDDIKYSRKIRPYSHYISQTPSKNWPYFQYYNVNRTFGERVGDKVYKIYDLYIKIDKKLEKYIIYKISKKIPLFLLKSLIFLLNIIYNLIFN